MTTTKGLYLTDEQTLIKEIFQNGEVLTVAKAKQLKGKKISTTNVEYHMNEPRLNTFTVGEIVSDWDDAERRKYPLQKTSKQYENYQQYWASYMTEKQIDEQKTRLVLFDNNGGRWHVAHTKYWNYYEQPTFTGSDADREVYFIVID